jgi:cell division protein FtsB
MRASPARQNKSKSLSSILSFGLFLFFFYPLVHGERGYFAWKGVEERLAEAQAEDGQVKASRESLERRVKMLRPDSVDPDLLDERARAVLGFLKPTELVIRDKQS